MFQYMYKHILLFRDVCREEFFQHWQLKMRILWILESTLKSTFKKSFHFLLSKLNQQNQSPCEFETTGCPIWMGWISKLNYREAMYILEISKAPFLMIRAYILFFQEILNF